MLVERVRCVCLTTGASRGIQVFRTSCALFCCREKCEWPAAAVNGACRGANALRMGRNLSSRCSRRIFDLLVPETTHNARGLLRGLFFCHTPLPSHLRRGTYAHVRGDSLKRCERVDNCAASICHQPRGSGRRNGEHKPSNNDDDRWTIGNMGVLVILSPDDGCGATLLRTLGS